MGISTRWQPLERRLPLPITGFCVAQVAADFPAADWRPDIAELGLIALPVGVPASRARC